MNRVTNVEFLPLTIQKNKVYAGFWLRLAAGLIDGIVLLLLLFIVVYIDRANLVVSAIFSILLFSAYPIYAIYFNAKYGGTLGKLAMGIRISLPDGASIGWKQAWLRSSVDVLIALLDSVAILFVFSQLDPSAYLAINGWERLDMLEPLYPKWSEITGLGGTIWILSEFIVLLFNKRNRAIHDYIAGTVVIRKEYWQTIDVI